jgi:predicted nuclease of predicted toxin-antitoxin system
MRFIIDAQLPYGLKNRLINSGFNAIHTRDLPEKNLTDDIEVIRVAVAENRIVISKDSDFLKWHLLRGQPEKLVIIATGNIANSLLFPIFEKNLPLIIDLLETHNVVEMSNNFVIGKKL